MVSTGAELGCTSSTQIKKRARFRSFPEFHEIWVALFVFKVLASKELLDGRSEVLKHLQPI